MMGIYFARKGIGFREKNNRSTYTVGKVLLDGREDIGELDLLGMKVICFWLITWCY
jgi:hypothetical protein